uniref:Uncharacterized protein n=1 Tax=Eubacterium plexicaudatum ASF492 TaxID=1235802 RepID=N2ABT2_9FIRM
MYTSKTKKTDSMLPVYLSDRCGRLYPHSDSGRALYFAAFIYNAGRTHPGRKAWRYSCMCLHHDGAFGTSGVCGRRRSRLCFKTQLRLSSWICGCLLCDGTYSKSGKESRTWQVAFGKLYRTCHRVFFWNALLLPDKPLLSGNTHRPVAAVPILLSSGSTRRYCIMRSWRLSG